MIGHERRARLVRRLAGGGCGGDSRGVRRRRAPPCAPASAAARLRLASPLARPARRPGALLGVGGAAAFHDTPPTLAAARHRGRCGARRAGTTPPAHRRTVVGRELVLLVQPRRLRRPRPQRARGAARRAPAVRRRWWAPSRAAGASVGARRRQLWRWRAGLVGERHPRASPASRAAPRRARVSTPAFAAPSGEPSRCRRRRGAFGRRRTRRHQLAGRRRDAARRSPTPRRAACEPAERAAPARRLVGSGSGAAARRSRAADVGRPRRRRPAAGLGTAASVLEGPDARAAARLDFAHRRRVRRRATITAADGGAEPFARGDETRRA